MSVNSLLTWELVNILHTLVFVLFLNVDHTNTMYTPEM